LLIAWGDWRLVFFVNLVLGAAAWVPARRLLRETRDPDRGAAPDTLGIAMLAGGVALLSLAIVEAPDWGWGSARVVGSFLVGVALLGLFVRRSMVVASPVLELSLLKVRTFAVACAGMFVFALGFYAVLLSNILFLTGVWGWSALHAGIAVTPGPLMAALSSALAGRVIDRFGPRVAAVPGGVVFALGCALFAVGLGSSPAYVSEFLPATLLTGCGVGLSFAGFSSAAVLRLPPARFSTGSAVANCFRQLGAVLGISVLIAVVGTAPVMADFTRAYWLMAACGLTAGLIGVTLGRNRGTVAVWTSKSAPSTTPSLEPAPSAAQS
jgi:MFS family permease